jgi:GNAT superfamily N-acetyltransferase
MAIEIKPLQKRDFNSARKFAVEGMHLAWYANKGLELFVYSWYFWFLEITRATKCYGAYHNAKLVGVLLADVYNEPKVYASFWRGLFVKIVSFVIKTGYQASSVYDSANEEMLYALRQKRAIDGEINFLAVDPAAHGKGIGTVLLNQLEADEKGKRLFLYTDSGSTYQFYEKRGFAESGRKEIKMTIHNKEVPLICLVFSKTLGNDADNRPLSACFAVPRSAS